MTQYDFNMRERERERERERICDQLEINLQLPKLIYLTNQMSNQPLLLQLIEPTEFTNNMDPMTH